MVVPELAPGTRVTDPKVLRALGHPARLQMLEHLQQQGGATATQCATVVGLSPSACSWHLRQLAAAGLVRDGGGRGDGRERLWECLVPAWHVDTMAIEAEPAEAQSLNLAVTQALLSVAATAVEEFVARAALGQEPERWVAASVVNNSTIRVTAEELEEVNAQVLRLLRPFLLSERPEPLPEHRTVQVALRLVPVTAPDGG